MSFDVYATSAVTVHIIHSPMTKPMINSRWPLDPDIEVVVTIDVVSRTVNDNKVSCFLCTKNGKISQIFQERREDYGQAEAFLGGADIGLISVEKTQT